MSVPHSKAMKNPLRIVLTGAESSGKSSLTRHLGEKFKLPYALEYARVYLEKHGPNYDYNLLKKMARQQRAYQQAHVSASTLIGLYDTDLINYKIWAEEVFGRCPREIEQAILKEQHHIYLLCKPDLPWEPDPLRENPEDRSRLFERHRQEILRLNRPCKIVGGVGNQRFLNAEAALNKLLQTCHS